MEGTHKSYKRSHVLQRLLALAVVLVVFMSSNMSALAVNYNGRDYANVAGSNIYYDAGVSAGELSTTVTYYSQLPIAIRQYFIKLNCNIYMISTGGSRSLDGEATLPSVSVYSDYSIASVDYSRCRIEYFADGRTNDDGTLQHEMAHVLDTMAMIKSGYYNDSFCGISNTPEWNALYRNNYNKLLNYDGSTRVNVCRDSCEGFAEAVRILYTNPDALIAISPDMYNYIIAQLSKVTGGDCTPPSKVVQNPVPASGTAVPQTIEHFDYVTYADTYPDLYAAFGYNREYLYAHYMNCGIREGRVAYFK